MDIRYTAEWIERQHVDEYGEWNPDDDEYRGMDFDTLEKAKVAAVKYGKQAGVCEWARVTVEQFNPSLGIPRRVGAAWDVIAVWHGDWEGNWDEERCAA
jgi:hypothetical protein